MVTAPVATAAWLIGLAGLTTAQACGGGNSPPTASGLDVTTYMGVEASGQLAGQDPDGDPLTYALHTAPSSGTVVIDANTGAFTYTPDAGFYGNDSFELTVSDGQQESAPAQIQVTVYPLTDGTVDTSFGTNGFATLDLGPGDELTGATVLSSGRIVAVGGSQSAVMLIAGFTPDGILDPGFAGNGYMTLDPGGYDGLYAVAQQPSGRLVAAGQSVGGTRDFALVGFTQDGALDPTFGTNGLVTTDVGGYADAADAMAVLPDGRLLVAGYANNGSDDDFALVRYTADGGLDSTFGTGGIETFPLGSGTDRIHAVALDATGRVVAVGEHGNGTDSDIAVARFDADGQPDTTFGTGGVYILDRGSNETAVGLALTPSGDILVGGYTGETGTTEGLVLALDASGVPDPTFGTGTAMNAGTTLLDNGTDGFAPTSVLAQPDGSLLLFGSTVASGNYQLAAARVLQDGQLDTSFGTGGFYQQAVPGSTGNDIFFGAVMQPDGDVIAVGWTYQADLDALLVRFTR